MQLHLWFERVNDDFIIKLPWLKFSGLALRHQSVTFDAASSRIISNNDKLARQEVVAKPDLVFGQKPIRVMSNVELPIRCAWGGAFENETRDAVLNMLIPIQVFLAMFSQSSAGCRNGTEIPWRKEANDVVDYLGREFKQISYKN